MIKVDHLRVQYDKKVVIEDLSFTIKENQITTIIGPNGCGKSTLLKAISKNLAYQSGSIVIEGTDLKRYKTKDLAKSMAILPQSPKVPADFSVGELVGFGRHPFIPFGKRFSRKDYDIVNWAMEKTDMSGFRCRKVNSLSGGERQRAWIAMALAQEPEILLLDEPTTYLDIAHQFETLELIKEIGSKMAMTIVMVLHDINQAARYSDEIIVMKEGAIIAQGTPEETIHEATMRDVFSLKGDFFEHSDYPHFIPVESHRQKETRDVSGEGA